MLKIFLRGIFGFGVIFYLLTIFYIIYSYFSYPAYLYQTDLMASFLTGSRIIRDGQVNNLYSFDTQQEYQHQVTAPFVREKLLPFRNIPLVGLMYVPLTYVSLKTATIIVFVLNVIFLFVFNRMFSKHASKPFKEIKLLLIALFFWPSIATLLSGQNAILILIIFTAIYFLLKNNKYFLAGMATSLLLLRPQSMLFLPFLWPIIKEKTTFLKGFLLSAFLFVVLNILISGLPVLLKYPDFVMASEVPEYGNRLNQISSMYVMFKQLLPQSSSAQLIVLNLATYIIVFSVYYLFHKRRLFEDNFMIGILATPIFSIHTLSHDLIILLIPIYLLLLKTDKNQFDKLLTIAIFVIPAITWFGNALFTTISIFLILNTLIFRRGEKDAVERPI